MADVPLAARMRPRTPAEFVGQTHLVGPGRALTKLTEKGSLPSLILWGPAGSGKTTLAHLLADAVGAHLMQLSAVNSGVADARKVMEGARGGLFKTVLFVDEVHRWSKAQQDVLLPAVEEGTVTLIGATTENPYFSLNTPLLSRCLLMRLEPLAPDDVAGLIRRALDDAERGLGGHGLAIDDDALEHLVSIAGGDARMALMGLEAAALAAEAAGEPQITLELAADAVQRKAIVYDRQGDAHYDVISAFIKSIRGSDPDAALFWLARMIEAGEDARYIARRMVVHASEDIGSADPVPLHLKEASGHPGLRKLGYGKGYKYPHDYPGHLVDQEYRPVRYQGRRDYRASGEGEEAQVAEGSTPEPGGYDSGSVRAAAEPPRDDEPDPKGE